MVKWGEYDAQIHHQTLAVDACHFGGHYVCGVSDDASGTGRAGGADDAESPSLATGLFMVAWSMDIYIIPDKVINLSAVRLLTFQL